MIFIIETHINKRRLHEETYWGRTKLGQGYT